MSVVKGVLKLAISERLLIHTLILQIGNSVQVSLDNKLLEKLYFDPDSSTGVTSTTGVGEYLRDPGTHTYDKRSLRGDLKIPRKDGPGV